MIFKAIIYVESRFQYDAVGCTGNGRAARRAAGPRPSVRCLGAMQTGPRVRLVRARSACSRTATWISRRTRAAPDWANSVFNPAVNIELGIAGIAGNRAQVKKQFPGCTEDQYTMMAIGNFNSYGSTKSCTVYNFDVRQRGARRVQAVLDRRGLAGPPLLGTREFSIFICWPFAPTWQSAYSMSFFGPALAWKAPNVLKSRPSMRA